MSDGRTPGGQKYLRALSAIRSIDLTTPIRMRLISLQLGKDLSVNDESPDELLALLMEVNRRLVKYDQAVAAGYDFPETDPSSAPSSDASSNKR